MSNPVFNNSEVFGLDKNGNPRAMAYQRSAENPAYGTQQSAYGTPQYGTAPQYGQAGPQYGQAGQYGQPGPYGQQYGAPDPATLDAMYNAPSATPADTKRLTYDDVIMKTGGLLALLIVAAAFSWVFTKQVPGLWIAGALVGLVLGLVNSFRRSPSPALIVGYTVAEGVFLGGISWAYAQYYSGAVPLAVLGTLVTFVGCLALFRSGKVRVTNKFVRWLLVAMVGYLAFSIINVVLLMTGVLDGWGMRTGPFGFVVALIAIGLAAASLIVDFDSIKRGVEAGVPAKFAWSASFGLLVTLIWLYLELLRFIAIFGGRQ